MEFGRTCDSVECLVNIVAVKIFRILYGFIRKLRLANMDAYMSDLIPTGELDLVVERFLKPNGFNRALVFDYRFPTCKFIL